MTSDRPSYQTYFDELIAWATGPEKQHPLLIAKTEFFKQTGEVFEDDPKFEMRMAAFLEHFLFDREPGESAPADLFYERVLREGPAERAAAFRAFTETQHGLFQIRKLRETGVVLRELFSGMEYDVTERRHLVGLDKGDVLEARLVPFAGYLLFTQAFCHHPAKAIPCILKEVKRLKKADPTRNPRLFIADCARRALKADRYRQIAIEKIYDFETNPI